jgi:hypothetical protein
MFYERTCAMLPMKVTSFYPVVMTRDVAGTAAFYQSHFGFVPLFSSDWYVHLQLANEPSVNLAVLDGSHETVSDCSPGRARCVDWPHGATGTAPEKRKRQGPWTSRRIPANTGSTTRPGSP